MSLFLSVFFKFSQICPTSSTQYRETNGEFVAKCTLCFLAVFPLPDVYRVVIKAAVQSKKAI
jgi:hypothetical protein